MVSIWPLFQFECGWLWTMKLIKPWGLNWGFTVCTECTLNFHMHTHDYIECIIPVGVFQSEILHHIWNKDTGKFEYKQYQLSVQVFMVKNGIILPWVANHQIGHHAQGVSVWWLQIIAMFNILAQVCVGAYSQTCTFNIPKDINDTGTQISLTFHQVYHKDSPTKCNYKLRSIPQWMALKRLHLKGICKKGKARQWRGKRALLLKTEKLKFRQ